MRNKYDHKILEKNIQKEWLIKNIYKHIFFSSKKNFFTCSMLPYPSGKLHMGHLRNYTINDIIYRYLRMNQYNVIMPMGWDAFGLPAENAAIENFLKPIDWVNKNVFYMKKQMKSIGLSIDWNNEIITCNKKYYKWNQWIFLKMFYAGLIYRKKGIVNWDPVDKTVLANEQVIDGLGWRSGAKIIKKKIFMYYARITNYVEDLISGLDYLKWPNNVKLMQKKWINKKIGISLCFLYKKYKIWGFLLKIFFLFKITFILIPYTNIFLEKIFKLKFIKLFNSEQKNIYKKTNIYINNNIINFPIRIIITNDIKYPNNILFFINNKNIEKIFLILKYKLPIVKINKKNIIKNIKNIEKKLIKKKLIKRKNITNLFDWGISRQRYWGTPIPMINCRNCGNIPLRFNDLPVLLPLNCIPNGKKNVLKENKDFLNIICYKCKNIAKRETDTMDTFIDSSWYYIRYIDPNNDNFIINKKKLFWLPVDQYIGGIEHSILHLLYSRFFIKVLKDLNIININEPFKNLLTQGMILYNTYYIICDKTKKKIWVNPKYIKILKNKKYIYIINNKEAFLNKIEKMSKSKKNIIDPNEEIKKWGADTLRLYIIFSAPLEKNFIWSSNNIKGCYRFLNNLWNLCFKYYNKKKFLPLLKKNENNKDNYFNEIKYLLNLCNKNYKEFNYNTIVSNCMKILNILEKLIVNFNKNFFLLNKSIFYLLKVLYPITPHICYKIWNILFYKKNKNLIDNEWLDNIILDYNKYNNFLIKINNKLKFSFYLNINVEKKNIFKKKLLFMLKEKNILMSKPKKIIYIFNKIINFIF